MNKLSDWLNIIYENNKIYKNRGLNQVREVANRMKLMNGPIAKNVIIVSGTNGKGSTVAIIDYIARIYGFSIARYSSPHLIRYNERLILNGNEVSDTALINAFEQINKARLLNPEINLSYFEFGTLAAALIISKGYFDIAVLEVGLGGRLDAVNIFDADVAVITTVSQDHADYLGNDIEVIGFEKAGIMRSQAPVILGSSTFPKSVTNYAYTIGVSTIRQITYDFHIIEHKNMWHWQGLDAQGFTIKINNIPKCSLPINNAATALQALILTTNIININGVRNAFKYVNLPGRLQWLGNWCLDVAHNPQAANYIAHYFYIKDKNISRGIRVALLAMLCDKDAECFIKALLHTVDLWVVASLHGARARSGESLSQIINKQGGEVIYVANSVLDGIIWIQSSKNMFKEVLVCGSFFTVAAVIDFFKK
ncbi:Bifunctional protein FolC [Candidatus Johnevansia muelleri]|uniref:Bifunctional protein FolC n=1 Tax=Candidatus Johnevansia muelleri TaxID=1495769 RepID=A0A078KHR0_9GAMM|nr:Bifunctional protein FolC [Candidatus Evansia muelleri]